MAEAGSHPLTLEEADGMVMLGAELELTCSACPEQYDLLMAGRMIGYLRLRHGYFTAEYPDVGGDLVFEAELGDGIGVFTDEERGKYLPLAVKALVTRHKQDE
jgi:hypothetical protein